MTSHLMNSRGQIKPACLAAYVKGLVIISIVRVCVKEMQEERRSEKNLIINPADSLTSGYHCYHVPPTRRVRKHICEIIKTSPLPVKQQLPHRPPTTRISHVGSDQAAATAPCADPKSGRTPKITNDFPACFRVLSVLLNLDTVV